MEGVIKQAEESRNRSMNAAVRLHEDYLPLKNEIDRLRRECLGLDRLPDLHEEEGSTITPEYVYTLMFMKIMSDFYFLSYGINK